MGEGDTLKLLGASTSWLALQCIVKKSLVFNAPVRSQFLVYKIEALEDRMCKIFLCLGTSYMIKFSGTFCHLSHTLSYEMTILTLTL